MGLPLGWDEMPEVDFGPEAWAWGCPRTFGLPVVACLELQKGQMN